MGALPTPKPSALAKEAQKIKSQIDTLITKVQKDTNFTPTRAQLEEIADDVIDFINDKHSKISPHDSYLKAAVIDLTEVPVMTAEMQRLAFITALKDASHEMDLFLSCL